MYPLKAILVNCTDATVSALQQAMTAQGAAIDAYFPTIHAVTSSLLLASGEARLFVVEVRSEEEVRQLKWLSGSFVGQPIIALLPVGKSQALLIATMRAGAGQVVTLPLTPADFQEALECIAIQHGYTVQQARVYAVSGVTGGCGATTLALNLAWEMAQLQSGRCLLIELSFQMGMLASYLNVQPTLTLNDLFHVGNHLDIHQVQNALTPVTDRLFLLTGPYRAITPVSVSPRRVLELLDHARRLASTVVLDVPCTYDDLYFEPLAAADQVILVGEQKLPSIRNLKVIRDTLEREEGIRTPTLVINRYDPAIPGFHIERLMEVLQAPQLKTIASDYASVIASIHAGQSLGRKVPESPVVRDIARLARHLLGDRATAAEDKPRTTPESPLPTETVLPRTMRVLHVEDDRFQQLLTKHLLGTMEEFEFTITWAESEADALAAFGHDRFNLVILDYHLTQGNGLSCLRKLRRQDRQVPILAVSGVATPEVAAELLEAGADDFISKENLIREAFLTAVRGALKRASACQQRTAARSDGVSGLDTLYREVRRAAAARNLFDLLRCLHEFRESARQARLTAAQIQRLVETVATEMETGAGQESLALSRPVLLSTFLRLLGSSDDLDDRAN